MTLLVWKQETQGRVQETALVSVEETKLEKPQDCQPVTKQSSQTVRQPVMAWVKSQA